LFLLFRSDQYNSLCAVILCYFDVYFQKIAMDNKPKTMAT